MNKGNSNMDDAIFDFAFSMALGDATRRVAEDSDKDLGNDNVKNEVKKYVDTIIKGSKGVNFDSTVNNIQEFNQGFTFGKIQKLINMTMKYLYIKYYDNSEVRERYSQCYAPLDRLMRDFVYESYIYLNLGGRPGFKKTIVWSKMTDNTDYSSFQTAIYEIMNYVDPKQEKIHNKIEFDFMFWEKAKKLQNLRVEEQKTEVEELWKGLGVDPKQ